MDKANSSTISHSVSSSVLRNFWFVWPRTVRRCIEAAEALLLPGEKIIHSVSGVHEAGTAVLCLTNHRVLLVDKKMFRFSYEDISYGAIREISYHQQVMAAEAVFHISGRSLVFQSYNKKELHTVVLFVQHQVQTLHSLRARNEESFDSYVDVTTPVLDPIEHTRLQHEMTLKERVAQIPGQLAAKHYTAAPPNSLPLNEGEQVSLS